MFFFKKKDKKQIIINCEKLETRVAHMRNGRLEEYALERNNERNLAGSIFLGKIVNIEPSLEAAFVDIGYEKNAFLHFRDMLPASYDMVENFSKSKSSGSGKKISSVFSNKIRELTQAKAEKIREMERKKRKKISVKDIPTLFPPGSLILVQVSKGPIGTKGPRVTTNLTLPGKYLVLLPYSDHMGLSTKIEDPQERNRLRDALSKLDIPDGMGVICRTVAEGKKLVFFKRDLDMLLDCWQRVEEFMRNPVVPSVVFQEPNLLERTVRDFLTEDIDEIMVDDPEALAKLQGVLDKFIGKKISGKVRLYGKTTNIFENFNINSQIDDIFKREVQLPSGGYICIDETEALISIDVNTGKGRDRSKAQTETFLETNMEAAEEIARQLKLRNIGGLVVIDFIDMRSHKDRDKLHEHMIELTKDDKAKTKILPLSRFGLMEMARQREQESLKDTVFDICPYCGGSGRIKSVLSVSVEIQRRLNEILRRHKGRNISVRVIMHPSVMARLKNEDAGLFVDLENKYGKNLSFRADPSIHHEQFKLIDPDTQQEY